jgi:hypothetical protein
MKAGLHNLFVEKALCFIIWYREPGPVSNCKDHLDLWLSFCANGRFCLDPK